jgi:serine protease AprX
MNKNLERIRSSVNWGGKSKNVTLLAILALVLSLVLPMAPSLPHAPARIQPSLLAMATQQPDRTVSVIVQKTAKEADAEAAVSALGGTVTKDLRIINAFAAELKAKDVPQLATVDSVRWVSLDASMRSAAGEQVFTSWATITGTATTQEFTNAAAMFDSVLGPNNTYGYGKKVKGAFGGFVAEVTPGNAISKVEIVLRAYTPNILFPQSDTNLTIYVNDAAGNAFVLSQHAFDTCVGADQACTVYVDVTRDHTWKWADFDKGLELLIDQSRFFFWDKLYYDAIGLRVTSTSGADMIGDTGGDTAALESVDTSKQANVYNQVIRSSDLWNTNSKLQGRGVVAAVVDSGVYKTRDLGKRVRVNVNFNATKHDAVDHYGHGTFVAGIVAGNGSQSGNKYVGVAPRADLLNIRVSDDEGMSTESDVINALQWVLDNKAKYNIRVVNLSLNSSMPQSYHTSPLDAACEILWFNGVVVVVSAGNNGTAALFPPANDPFVITVGAADDKGTLSTSDDTVATFSAYGTTESGFAKPELVAPGRNIIGLLPENDKLSMSATHSTNRIDKNYFKMSGTSVSAPIVSGAVALLLQDEPNLNPDQVKYRLMATANKNWPGYNATMAGAGYLDVYGAVYGTTTQTANTGITASQLLWTGSTPPVWDSVQWGSVQWGSVQWGSVQWGSVQWGSVQWGSDYWGP